MSLSLVLTILVTEKYTLVICEHYKGSGQIIDI